MSGQPQVNLNIPVSETIAQAYTDLTNTYQMFAEVRQHDFPEDIVSLLYGELTQHLTAMLNEVRADQNNYARQATLRTREARRAMNAQRQPRQPQAPAPAPAPANSGAPAQLTLIPPNDIIVVDGPGTPPGPPPGYDVSAEVERVRIPIRRRRHVSRAIPKRELDVVIPEPCSICYEPYTKVNSVSTCCGHSFCKDCFVTHENTIRDQPISCPLCRKLKPTITEYRARARKAIH